MIFEYSPLADKENIKSFKSLLNIPDESSINDMVNLSKGFYETCQDLFTDNIDLNPTFEGSRDVGGADADFIINNCLYDIKTSKSKEVKDVPVMLRQLIGYALLDYSNQYLIEKVGVYYSRQKLKYEWNINELIQIVTGNSDLTIEKLRVEFRKVVNEVID